MELTRLHFADSLKQVCGKVAFSFVCSQFFVGEGLILRGHGESP